MAKRSDGGLGFFDRVILFTAWVTSCGLVFLLGYYVGKGEQRQRTTELAQRVVLPVEAPEAAGTEPATSPTLTFYDQLGRDSGDGTARPAAVPTRVTTSTRPAPPSTRPAPPSTLPRAVPSPRTTSMRPQAPPPPPLAPPPPPPAPPTTVPTARPGRSWTIYVSPTRDRFEAERRRASLAAQGYDASVARMQRDGDTWYRVRVGRYPDKARAESVRRELHDRFGVDHAFVLEE